MIGGSEEEQQQQQHQKQQQLSYVSTSSQQLSQPPRLLLLPKKKKQYSFKFLIFGITMMILASSSMYRFIEFHYSENDAYHDNNVYDNNDVIKNSDNDSTLTQPSSKINLRDEKMRKTKQEEKKELPKSRPLHLFDDEGQHTNQHHQSEMIEKHNNNYDSSEIDDIITDDAATTSDEKDDPTTRTANSTTKTNKTSSMKQRKKKKKNKKSGIVTIPYIVSLTSCLPKFQKNLYDLASVLRESIIRNTYPVNKHSKYKHKLFAIIPKSTKRSRTCSRIMSSVGYRVLGTRKNDNKFQYPITNPEVEINTTVVVSNYTHTDNATKEENDFLRQHIGKDGCCGEKELIKLHVYNFDDYPVAVHIDIDTLLLKPLDELFDSMLTTMIDSGDDDGRNKTNNNNYRKRVARRKINFLHNHAAPTFWIRNNLTIPVPTKQDQETAKKIEISNQQRIEKKKILFGTNIDAFFTKDYNMIPKGKENKVGVQGGFLVVRPNRTTYNELINIVKSGNYVRGWNENNGGWYGSGYGKHIWGSMTIQGLLAYYYDTIAPKGSAIELNRCMYNQIADNPRRTVGRGKYPKGTPTQYAIKNNLVNWKDSKYECRDGRTHCDDVQCQTYPLKETFLLHYTYCKSPTNCIDPDKHNYTLSDIQCIKMHQKWFEIRKEIDPSRNNNKDVVVARLPDDYGQYFPGIFHGFCKKEGGYIPLPQQ